MDKIIQETRGSRLRSRIQAAGYSQKEFAAAIDKSEQIVSQYVKDKAEMSPKTLSRAAQVLDTSVDYLLGRTDVDMPERFRQMVDAQPSGTDVRKISAMRFRTAHIRDLCRSMGVRFDSYMKIKNHTYFSNDNGKWIDENGNDESFETLIDAARENYQYSEYWTDVTFRGNTISMNEEMLNRWLGNLWNCLSYLLQTKFDVSDSIESWIVDDDITRAFKGLPEAELIVRPGGR